MSEERQNGLMVTFAIICLLTLLDGRASLLSVIAAYLAYASFRGDLTEIRRGLRLLLGIHVTLLILSFFVSDWAFFSLISNISRLDYVFSAIFISMAILLMSMYVSKKMSLGLLEFLLNKNSEKKHSYSNMDSHSNTDNDGNFQRTKANEAPVTTKNSQQDISMTQVRDDDYMKALNEFESNYRRADIYARLLVECDGDESKVRARYIAGRVADYAKGRQQDLDCLAKNKFVSEVILSEGRVVPIRLMEHGHVAVLVDGGYWVYGSKEQAENAIREGRYDRNDVIQIITANQLYSYECHMGYNL